MTLAPLPFDPPVPVPLPTPPLDFPPLFRSALTHPSAAAESRPPLPDNQRLEYLGDAVLGILSAEALYHLHPDWPEGALTKARSHLINETALAAVARAIALPPHILLGRGETAQGGRDKNAILADALEALFAALWLETGPDATRAVFRSWFASAIDSIPGGTREDNPKGLLQERCQAAGAPPPSYTVLSCEGPSHAPVWRVAVHLGDRLLAEAEGPGKHAAETAAARLALLSLP